MSTVRNVAKIAFCEVANEQVTERTAVRSLSALQRLLGPDCPPARVAIEACREAWHVHAKLTSWGNQVLLVDTTRVKRLGVGQHGRKTDRIDAEVLARAEQQNQIPTAHLLSPQRQWLRMQPSVRRALVQTRAQDVTTVRGLVRARGGRDLQCLTGVEPKLPPRSPKKATRGTVTAWRLDGGWVCKADRASPWRG